MTLSSSIALTIRDELATIVISEPSLPPLIDQKEKRTHSPSPTKEVGKAKKSRGPSFPLDSASSSNKASMMGATVEVTTPLNFRDTVIVGMGEALKGKEERLVTTEET